MKFTLLKDVLFTRDNKSLDIARLSSAASVIAYWAGVFMGRITGDAMAVGTGCAAVFGGAAAWIFARQKHETKVEAE